MGLPLEHLDSKSRESECYIQSKSVSLKLYKLAFLNIMSLEFRVFPWLRTDCGEAPVSDRRCDAGTPLETIVKSYETTEQKLLPHPKSQATRPSTARSRLLESFPKIRKLSSAELMVTQTLRLQIAQCRSYL